MENIALTPKQKLLVETLVTTGCSIKDAAKAAGYSQKGRGEAGRVTASNTIRLPHVRAYMQQCVQDAMSAAVPLAIRKLVALLEADSEHVQIEAARQILDRAGVLKPSKNRLNVSTSTGSIRIDMRSPAERARDEGSRSALQAASVDPQEDVLISPMREV